MVRDGSVKKIDCKASTCFITDRGANKYESPPQCSSVARNPCSPAATMDFETSLRKSGSSSTSQRHINFTYASSTYEAALSALSCRSHCSCTANIALNALSALP